jgi:hypothetical protein
MIMSQFSYDLAVAYRIYPKMSSNPPPVYADDKFKLAELCVKSFKESLGTLRVKVWVLLNQCPPEYETLFTQLWPAEDLVLVRYPGVSGSTTLHEQQRLLMEQTDADIVCLAEDDYFYLPNQFPLAVDFFKKNPDADFATVYDCPDLHTMDLHQCLTETRPLGGKNWRSSVSTTHAFLARRSALLECRALFDRLYSVSPDRPSPDLAMWMALTKKRVFNPVKFLCWLPAHPFWSSSIFLAWRYCWRQILFGRRYSLWTPYPSIATHMDARLEAPDVDWHKEYKIRMNAGKSVFSDTSNRKN